MKTEIVKAVSPVLTKITHNKAVMKIADKSPIIFGVGGIVLLIGGTVAACAGTLKLEETLDKTDRDIREAPDGREKTIAYVKGAANVAKLYAPAVGLDILGIACLGKSHGIMSDRYSGLAMAYEATRNGFKKYRQNVVEKYGAEADYICATESRKEKVTEVDEDGKKHKRELYASDLHQSNWNVLFDSCNPNFHYLDMYDGSYYIGKKGDTAANLFFIHSMEKQAEAQLRLEGRLYLDDVWKMFGFTQANNYNHLCYGGAHQLCKLYDDNAGPEDSVNQVRFIPESWENAESRMEFLNGAEEGIWLDFSDFYPVGCDCETWDLYYK